MIAVLIVFVLDETGLYTAVVVSHIADLKVHEEFFLNPPVQRFVDRVVRRRTGSGHRSLDVLILDPIRKLFRNHRH